MCTAQCIFSHQLQKRILKSTQSSHSNLIYLSSLMISLYYFFSGLDLRGPRASLWLRAGGGGPGVLLYRCTDVQICTEDGRVSCSTDVQRRVGCPADCRAPPRRQYLESASPSRGPDPDSDQSRQDQDGRKKLAFWVVNSWGNEVLFGTLCIFTNYIRNTGETFFWGAGNMRKFGEIWGNMRKCEHTNVNLLIFGHWKSPFSTLISEEMQAGIYHTRVIQQPNLYL